MSEKDEQFDRNDVRQGTTRTGARYVLVVGLIGAVVLIGLTVVLMAP
ncbi:hypothetical protein [Yunchengibacter salinarum]